MPSSIRPSAIGRWARTVSTPPNGAQFYPFFTTGIHDGTCTWQEGGNYIPGTVDHFGGNSTTKFGPPLHTLYPEPGFGPEVLIDNFNSGNLRNARAVGPVFGR
jgi:hypothetical protein